MKLGEAVKQYETCMKGDFGCLADNCPLLQQISLAIGEPTDIDGAIRWKIGGCSLMSRFEEWLKRKKPGTPVKC